MFSSILLNDYFLLVLFGVSIFVIVVRLFFGVSLSDLNQVFQIEGDHLDVMTLLFVTVLSMTCIIVGGYGIYKGSISSTDLNFFGAKLSTGSVGVAFAGIGALLFILVVRQIRPVEGRMPRGKKRKRGLKKHTDTDRE